MTEKRVTEKSDWQSLRPAHALRSRPLSWRQRPLSGRLWRGSRTETSLRSRRQSMPRAAPALRRPLSAPARAYASGGSPRLRPAWEPAPGYGQLAASQPLGPLGGTGCRSGGTGCRSGGTGPADSLKSQRQSICRGGQPQALASLDQSAAKAAFVLGGDTGPWLLFRQGRRCSVGSPSPSASARCSGLRRSVPKPEQGASSTLGLEVGG